MRAWQQSGQMFIAHIGVKNSPAPEERNVLAREVKHFALLELQTYLSPWCYKHLVPPGTRNMNDFNQQIYLKNSRVARLVLIGRT